MPEKVSINLSKNKILIRKKNNDPNRVCRNRNKAQEWVDFYMNNKNTNKYENLSKNGIEEFITFNNAFEGNTCKFKGILFAEGFWNGAYYSEEIVKSIFDKVDKVPLIVNHGHDVEFLDNNQKPLNIGRITRKEWNDILKGIAVEGIITNSEASELSRNGGYRGLSVKIKVDKDYINGINSAISADLYDISIVREPGCEICYSVPIFD